MLLATVGTPHIWGAGGGAQKHVVSAVKGTRGRTKKLGSEGTGKESHTSLQCSIGYLVRAMVWAATVQGGRIRQNQTKQ